MIPALLPLIVMTAHAQEGAGPKAVPYGQSIAAPQDTPYSGTLQLRVDLTDTARRIIQVEETIPVKAGKLTLLYPQWIPGNHSPTGPISALAGLVITANGNNVPWVRDHVDVYAFHVDVPAGVTSLQAHFQFLTPVRKSAGRISFSSKIADLAWNTVLLYPAGHYARQIKFSPSIVLPAGWQFASALEVQSKSENVVHFKEVGLHNLVDSPLYAGANFKRVDLSTDAENQVFLDLVSDKPADLAITPEQLQWHRNLVLEAKKLYGSHHYTHYDFLLLLSDTVGGIGLEHHQSSEDGLRRNYFTDWDANVAGRDLLGHEYTHSWNGKFRRPSELWTPNFNVPMRDDLLWVYEGMTQYWGYVLTARSGMRTAAQTRDLFALDAANFDVSPGREWRPLIDTTNQPTMSQRSPVSWVSWQRPEDYYTEGMLIWLDADTKIRELSGDTKSLDDFCKLFFGIDNGSYVTQTYTLENLVAALNKVQPFDWMQFLQTRVYRVAPKTPEDGITRGGYKLVYNDTPLDWQKKGERPDSFISFSTSLGLNVKGDGELGNVWWNSPAFKAGITPDMTLTAVNGETFSIEKLRTAITSAEKASLPITLLFKRGEEFQSISLPYHDGLRYPHLERAEGTPARLDAILSSAK